METEMTIATEIKKSFDAHVFNKGNGSDQEETYKEASGLGVETQHNDNGFLFSTFKFEDGSSLSYDIFDLWEVC